MLLPHEELTGTIIGAAIHVHRTLGPGFVESIYENSLVLELKKRGISFEQQLVVPVFYDGVEVGVHRLDLFVAGEIVVELKAVREWSPEHYVIVKSYLRAIKKEYGLLLNFGKTTLDIKRIAAL